MQHHITSRADNTSNRESICATGLHQNLNRAFVLSELTPANEISLLDPYERTLGKCCNDPLRPPPFSGESSLPCAQHKFSAGSRCKYAKFRSSVEASTASIRFCLHFSLSE